MLKELLTASVVAIAVTASGNMALAQSEEQKAKSCDRDTMVQSGTLTFDLTTIGFIVGVRWGEGILTLNDGFQIGFDVSGGKLLETGVAKANFEGEVYNLDDLEEFQGTYWGSSTKLSVVKGKGELQTNNSDCVFIRARSTGGGLQLSAPAPEGLAIKFER